ncbi:MAG: hypothetical protein M3347_17995 [Armatimonadota bacterium]|nr:hypothetical protein [Armatimonadota bacterium]
MLTKEQTASLLGILGTASITAIGFAIGGTIGASVMASIGINLSSTIIQEGSLKLKEQWLSSDVRGFLRKSLLSEVQFWFGEELKTDNQECNRAWRAFQRLLLEGIRADVQAVQANQELIHQDLQTLEALRDQIAELSTTIDRRLPDEPFQQGLETAVNQMQAVLEGIAETTLRTEKKVESIAADVKKLLDSETLSNQQRQASKKQTSRILQFARAFGLPKCSSAEQAQETLLDSNYFTLKFPLRTSDLLIILSAMMNGKAVIYDDIDFSSLRPNENEFLKYTQEAKKYRTFDLSDFSIDVSDPELWNVTTKGLQRKL